MTGHKKCGLVFAISASAVCCLAAGSGASGPAGRPELAAVNQLYGYEGPKTAMPDAAVPVPAFSAGAGGFTRAGSPADAYNALIWDPGSRGDWYEWWYYKVVVPGTRDAFYFCYGVVNPWDISQTNAASRSYVSAGSFGDNATFEAAFKPGDFSASSEAASVRIGGNTATDRALKGSLPAPGGGEFSWDLTLEKDWGINLMGWTMYQDWISNIFWYPAQAGAWMSGKINYRGRSVSLNRAPAYQDRNWGRSFPKWWTWLVSNNFKNSPGTILASGGGQPRIFPGIGFIQTVTIGLRHQGREYLFQPTSGDLVSVDVNFGKWEVSARNKKGERMEISAYAPREKFLLLQFMTPQGKMYNDYEALSGSINVKLYKDSELIADLETDDGGIEFGSFASFGSGPVINDSDAVSFEALFSGKNHLQ
jgi:tocopherol cyclase